MKSPENISTPQHLNISTPQLLNYTIHLADNALVLGHRNSEWAGHGPVLEQDIAISNVALDLIGQSRNLYQYAAELVNNNKAEVGVALIGKENITEDDLAYLRDVREFKNCLLVELPKGDWAKSILRQFFFSAYQFLLYRELQKSSDSQLAAIAEKSLKETTYHLRWSGDWVVRLGDGTEESHQRMLSAMDDLWAYTKEMFQPSAYEKAAAEQGFGVDITALETEWNEKVKAVFEEATLPMPEGERMQTGGKNGLHSEHLGFILADLQYLQRAYPNATW